MKIAVFCDSQGLGGLELNLGRLALRMQTSGQSVVFLPRAGSRLEAWARKHQLRVRPVAPIGKHYWNLAAAYRLAKLCREEQVEAVIFSLARNLYTMAYAKAFFMPRVKTLYLQQMTLGKQVKKNLLQRFNQAMLDYWVAPLPYLKAEALERTTLPAEKIPVIPLGIAPEEFERPENAQAQARQMLNLPQEAFLVGTIGRIAHKKGHLLVVEALAQLRKVGYDIRGVFVGEPSRKHGGEFPARLNERIRELGLQEAVYFRPFTEEVRWAYFALDIKVVASYRETYGMVTVEALASGTPVVGTRSGGTEEILAGGQYGLLFEQENAEDLAEQLRCLYQQPEKRHHLAQTGPEAAQAYYDFRRVIPQLQNLVRPGHQ